VDNTCTLFLCFDKNLTAEAEAEGFAVDTVPEQRSE
jgi:hypothetical protein